MLILRQLIKYMIRITSNGITRINIYKVRKQPKCFYIHTSKYIIYMLALNVWELITFKVKKKEIPLPHNDISNFQ